MPRSAAMYMNRRRRTLKLEMSIRLAIIFLRIYWNACQWRASLTTLSKRSALSALIMPAAESILMEELRAKSTRPITTIMPSKTLN